MLPVVRSAVRMFSAVRAVVVRRSVFSVAARPLLAGEEVKVCAMDQRCCLPIFNHLNNRVR
jgi:hypothetical protein